MFTAHAFSEMPLLIFTLLVPIGLCAIAAQSLIQSTAKDEAALKKSDTLLIVSVIVTLVGLVASFFHLTALGHIFNMANGLGRSLLTNEIAVAGVSIFVAVVFWIFVLVKKPGARARLICGIVLAVLGVSTAVMTGVAYMIPTIPVWNGPWGIILQLGLGLAGGCSLAAAILSTAKIGAGKLSPVVAIGGVLVIIAVIGLYTAAGASVPSSGIALDMSGAITYVAGAIVLVVIGAILQFIGARKGNAGLAWAGFICLLIGLCLARMVFYGCYGNIGLAM